MQTATTNTKKLGAGYHMAKSLLRKLEYKPGDLMMVGETFGDRTIHIDPEARAWDIWLMVHNVVKNDPASAKYYKEPFPEFQELPLQGQLW